MALFRSPSLSFFCFLSRRAVARCRRRRGFFVSVSLLSLPSFNPFALSVCSPSTQPNAPLVRAGRVHAPKVDVVEADDLGFLIGGNGRTRQAISVSKGIDSSRANLYFLSFGTPPTVTKSHLEPVRPRVVTHKRARADESREQRRRRGVSLGLGCGITVGVDDPHCFLFCFLCCPACSCNLSVSCGADARESVRQRRVGEKREAREKEKGCETVFALSAEGKRKKSDSVSSSPLNLPHSFSKKKKLFRWPAAAANEPRRGLSRRSSREAPLLRSRPAARGLIVRCALTRLVGL